MAKDALDSVTKEPENEELLKIIEKEEDELREIESKLQSLQGDWNPANDEIVKQIMSRDALFQKEITKRSKICKNLIATIKDSVCPKNMNDFLVRTLKKKNHMSFC
ncbi:HOP2-like protein [Saccharomyces kudriavzevii IFO 1802]|nr:Hop2p [Saccharomyces cerevisiae x Saccharomyces kudriavzevii VIN7]EJT43741.1 HOP2-like protein [Saccharomyces kudriavzevii IFO 1802]